MRRRPPSSARTNFLLQANAHLDAGRGEHDGERRRLISTSRRGVFTRCTETWCAAALAPINIESPRRSYASSSRSFADHPRGRGSCFSRARPRCPWTRFVLLVFFADVDQSSCRVRPAAMLFTHGPRNKIRLLGMSPSTNAARILPRDPEPVSNLRPADFGVLVLSLAEARFVTGRSKL